MFSYLTQTLYATITLKVTNISATPAPKSQCKKQKSYYLKNLTFGYDTMLIKEKKVNIKYIECIHIVLNRINVQN